MTTGHGSNGGRLRSLVAMAAMAMLASGCVWIERVSLTDGGGELAQGAVVRDISEDGRYVLFYSFGAFEPDDTNGVADMYRRDTLTDTVVRVSVGAAGEGNGNSLDGEISDDGRYVAFESSATNLVPDDLNGVVDVFVRDIDDEKTVRVSESTVGGEGNGLSTRPAISGDGTRIAFESAATNLVVNDTNGVDDVFVHTVATGSTVAVSRSATGVLGNNGSHIPALDFDGSEVAFESNASNLVPGITNVVTDVFVKSSTGAIDRVSVSTGGAEADGNSGDASISASGLEVAFRTLATNLVPSDTNGNGDVVMRDRGLGVTFHVSLLPDGSQPPSAGSASISAGGGYIAWSSSGRVFVTDLFDTASTVLVSVAPNGDPVDGAGGMMSADGRYVAFTSADPIVADDTNGMVDGYVVAWREPAPSLAVPSALAADSTVPVTITGSGFDVGAKLTDYGNVLRFSNVVVQSSTSITADVTTPAGAAPGLRTVTVENPDGGPGLLSHGAGICFCFVVTP